MKYNDFILRIAHKDTMNDDELLQFTKDQWGLIVATIIDDYKQENKQMSFYDVIRDVESTIDERIDDLKEAGDDYEEILIEIVDSCIPIYNSDLLSVCDSKLDLLYGNGSHEDDIVQALQSNLFDELLECAHDYYETSLSKSNK